MFDASIRGRACRCERFVAFANGWRANGGFRRVCRHVSATRRRGLPATSLLSFAIGSAAATRRIRTAIHMTTVDFFIAALHLFFDYNMGYFTCKSNAGAPAPLGIAALLRSRHAQKAPYPARCNREKRESSQQKANFFRTPAKRWHGKTNMVYS